MAADKFILFDIPGRTPAPYSPNTWKVRLALNYKAIPYTTRWVEIADIEETCKTLGIPPSTTYADGSPHFTFPAIIDNNNPEKPIKMSDSRPIIKYLEETYPAESGKELFVNPDFQHKVQDVIWTQIQPRVLMIWGVYLNNIKTPRDQVNFRRRIEARVGKPLEEFVVTGEGSKRILDEIKETLSEIEDLALESPIRTGDGPFLLGANPTFVDFALGAFMICAELAVKEQWDIIASSGDSRWGRFLEDLKAWSHVDGYKMWQDDTSA